MVFWNKKTCAIYYEIIIMRINLFIDAGKDLCKQKQKQKKNQ
jgi:hypothetical protein